jgi:hypothetical protein
VSHQIGLACVVQDRLRLVFGMLYKESVGQCARRKQNGLTYSMIVSTPISIAAELRIIPIILEKALAIASQPYKIALSFHTFDVEPESSKYSLIACSTLLLLPCLISALYACSFVMLHTFNLRIATSLVTICSTRLRNVSTSSFVGWAAIVQMYLAHSNCCTGEPENWLDVVVLTSTESSCRELSNQRANQLCLACRVEKVFSCRS